MESLTAWWYRPWVRLIPAAGAVVFCAFFITAFVLRRAGVSDDVTVRVAGAMAYGFLTFALVVALTERRRAAGRARREAEAFVAGDPGLAARVGTPVRARVEGDPPPRDEDRWTPVARVAGPRGDARVAARMVRRDGGWRGEAVGDVPPV